MATKKLLAEYRKKGFCDVRIRPIYEGRRKVDLITAKAKKTTPVSKMSLDTRSTRSPRVHIATYVPSTKRTNRFSTRYAKKKC